MKDWAQERRFRIDDTNQVRQLAITESTTDLVAMLDVDGFLIHLNKAGYAMLELADDTDITQIRMASLLSEESATEFVRHDIPRAVSSGASHSELDLKNAAGKYIPVSQVLIAHNDATGYLSHFSVILRDITPIKEAEAEREKLIQQLHQSRKLETLGRLAGGVAHDFNNLMTVIMGYSELGLMNTGEGKSCQAELDVILQSACKAARLSSQLLDFSSKRMIEPQVVNLNEVLQDSLKLVKSMLGEGISVRLNTADALWPVRIDRSQLDQIILNLTVNARDALNFQGVYTLSTENRKVCAEEAMRLGLGKAGDFVVLRVSDTGCGMEQEVLDQIFDPFFTTKERGKGTGLGLSSVYGAVKQNKGSITVTSTPGKGSIFEICIPRATPAKSKPGNEGEHTAQGGAEAGTENILLVEDNSSVRNLLSRVLSKRGYRVLEAENGLDALKILEEEKNCDLIISDIVMPKMNGVELYRELQKGDFPARLMFMSGYTDELISPKELTASNIPLLKKPFQCDKFVKLIREVLDAPLANAACLST